MDVGIQVTGIAPDPMGNIELTRFGSTAILYCGGDEPFMVAKGYDRKTGEWSGEAVYVDDLSVAWDIANPEIIEEATVKWTRGDIAEILNEKGIEPCEWNIDAVIENPVIQNSIDLLRGDSRSAGAEYINQIISSLLKFGCLDVPEGFRLEEGLDDIAERMDACFEGDDMGCLVPFGDR